LTLEDESIRLLRGWQWLWDSAQIAARREVLDRAIALRGRGP
jgi:hypothetical protein